MTLTEMECSICSKKVPSKEAFHCESFPGNPPASGWFCIDHVELISSIAHLSYVEGGIRKHSYSVTRSELYAMLKDDNIEDVRVLKMTGEDRPSRKWVPKRRSNAYRRGEIYPRQRH